MQMWWLPHLAVSGRSYYIDWKSYYYHYHYYYYNNHNNNDPLIYQSGAREHKGTRGDRMKKQKKVLVSRRGVQKKIDPVDVIIDRELLRTCIQSDCELLSNFWYCIFQVIIEWWTSDDGNTINTSE